MYADGEPAAGFILQWSDSLYYPEIKGTAGIIHKLAIRRLFAGQNLFAPILDFCKQECLNRELHEIRLETDATRPALMNFYERWRFEKQYQRRVHEFGEDYLCQFYVLYF